MMNQVRETFEAPDGWNRDDRPPTIAVIETIATVTGVDPIDVDFRLNDTVDPDALDALFLDEKPGNVKVNIVVGGRSVTIRSDGSIRVGEGKNWG